MFRDQFTDFVFNDISSKSMKVWITNDHDLTEPISPEISDTFVAPSLSDGRYYAGTTISKTDITLKCIAVNITVQEKREITRWLSPKTEGKLILGSDPYHYYNVKISNAIQASKWIKSKYDKIHGGYLYIYEFSITFTTVDDWANLGVPVSIDLKYLKYQNKELNEKFDNVEEAKKWYEYNNTFNEYQLPYVLRSNYIFLLPGLYTWNELRGKLNLLEHWRDTSMFFLRGDNNEEALPSIIVSILGNHYAVIANDRMEDLYPSTSNNPIFKDQEYFPVYYPVIIESNEEKNDETTSLPYTELAYSIVNPGSLPMYYNYFINGHTGVKNDDTDSSIDFKISLDDDPVYGMGINIPYSEYYYNFSIDSNNGIILNNGDFCQNAFLSQLSINQEEKFLSKGRSSLRVGNPEILDLTINNQPRPKALFRTFGESSVYYPYPVHLDTVILKSGEVLSYDLKISKPGFYSIKINGAEEQQFVLSASNLKFSVNGTFVKDGNITMICKNTPTNYNEIKANGTEFIFQVEEIIDSNQSAKINFSLTRGALTLSSSSKVLPNNKCWYYVEFNMKNNFKIAHNGLVHISFFNKKNIYSSSFSLNEDDVPEDFQIDNNNMYLTAFAIPYKNKDGENLIKFICSPLDFSRFLKPEEKGYDFINKYVSEENGEYTLTSIKGPNTVGEHLFDFDFNRYYKYLSICEAQKMQIIKNSKDDGCVLNETLTLQVREV